MRTGNQRVLAGVPALPILISLAASLPSWGCANDPLIKLSHGAGTSACAVTRTFRQWRICYVHTSACLGRGGHVGQDPADDSGAPHCLSSDLAPIKK
jgi:hypothetical protein